MNVRAFSEKSYRPSDPSGQSSSDVGRFRRALRGLDPRLDLWWDEPDSRWKVMEWMEKAGRWSYALTWQGQEKQFRGLDGSVEPLIEHLGRIDCNRYGTADNASLLMEQGWESGRREKLESAKAEQRYIRKHALTDIFERDNVRQTFGAGGKPRSRNFQASLVQELRDSAEAVVEAGQIT
jgi:hypothetical protein